MLKSVVMAYHFIGPDGPTDSRFFTEPPKPQVFLVETAWSRRHASTRKKWHTRPEQELKEVIGI